MKHTAIIIAAGLMAAALTGFITYEALRHKEFKYHDKLNKIAQKVNSLNSTWKAGENAKWVNSDITGVKAHMGVILDKKSSIQLETVSHNLESAETLPVEFDSRV